jgi:NAD(P)-dependent dehydrogenase (short-subunit alcohol dehydrogenase family)
MRTIVVTGSASGIGAATAERLRKDGHRVIGVDLRAGDVVADLGTEAGRRAALAGIERASGGALEGVVSAAGAGPYDDAATVTRVNYFGAVAMLDGLLELLARGRAPAAVAISSIGAVFDALIVPGHVEACLDGDEPRALREIEGRDGNTAYVNAKRAFALAVRRRAPAWGARGVRLNAILPGSIATPMLDKLHAHEGLGPMVRALPKPLGREARAEEVAGPIAFLLGPDASYVHGELLHVGGGSDAVVRPDAL